MVNLRTKKWVQSVSLFYEDLLSAIKDSQKRAYTYYGNEYSYSDLFKITRAVFGYLLIHKNEPVLHFYDKSLASYGTVYGILFSGNIWVPISSEQPEDRVFEIIRMSKAKTVLTDRDLSKNLENFILKNEIRLIKISDLPVESKTDLPIATLHPFDGNDIAYIMFTSGSTGTPKGVPMSHRNFTNFIKNCMEILPFGEDEVFSDYHDFAFDISIFYLFCCPLAGGVFAPVKTKEGLIFPLKFMQENKITFWSSVPSVISRIRSLSSNAELPTSIRTMFLCGEPFSLKVLEYCYQKLHIKSVYNFYGLTETGVENFWHKCSPEDLLSFESIGYVPIGQPLPGNFIEITPEKELLLSGCQITSGYLGEIGHEKFCNISGRTWFHTGDLVEQINGLFFCKGRLDSQVKISGYRIELMEIEFNMKRCPGVEEAVCWVRTHGDQNALMGAVKIKEGQTLSSADLKSFLLKALPSYMVPKKIGFLSEIPVNSNGKLDRRQIRTFYS